MRNLNDLDIDRYRNRSPRVIAFYGGVGDETCGVFDLPSPIDNCMMHVVASQGEGWDHVSVSRQNRCPNWTELEHVKRLFFQRDETAMQLHVPSDEHISLHPYCLHLWRPNDGRKMPMPPSCMVG